MKLLSIPRSTVYHILLYPFKSATPQRRMTATGQNSPNKTNFDIHNAAEASFVTFGRPPLNDVIKPLSWLLGKWQSTEAYGKYPTIKDFKYKEVLEFTHVGQPNIQFSFYAFHPETDKPLHRELGFLRLKPGTDQVALIIAQNTGLAEVEEGTIAGHEIITESHTVGRMSFGKPPATMKVKRIFRLEGETLEQVVAMETEKTPMTEHLRVKYKRG